MINEKKTVKTSDLFGSIADQLRQDRSRINDLDRVGGNGNHGDNMVANFEMLAKELRNEPNEDAGVQLRHAAELMQQRGRGASAQIYAEGLRQASQQVAGKQGIGLEDLVPLLQGLLGGVQSRTDAQPGQGTMMDALIPGIMGFIGARSAGRGGIQAAMEAIQAATQGANQTQRQPSQYGQYRREQTEPYQDPGASSGASFLQGLFNQFIGG